MSVYAAPPHDTLTYVGMALLVAAVVPAAAWVFAAGKWRAGWAWLAAGASVMGLSAALAATAVLAQVEAKPPMLPALVAVLLIQLLWRGFSAQGLRAAKAMSPAALVLLQSFRLPLELLMLHAAAAGVMPVEFSTAGYNLDVVTGALALPLGLALLRGRRLPAAVLWAWNLWGIGCLCVIVVLAVLTSPNVAFFGRDTVHLSIWVLYFPYVWLPAVLVGVAIYGHIAICTRLLSLSTTTRRQASRR